VEQSVARPLPAQDNASTEYSQTSMRRVGFEPTSPEFERAKTFHAVDRAATVIGEIILKLELQTRQSWGVPVLLLLERQCYDIDISGIGVRFPGGTKHFSLSSCPCA
jgi:hypothetical protein